MDTVWLNEGGIIVDGKSVFSEGDPSPSGHPPTRISARFLNNQMYELVNLVKNAGFNLNWRSDTQIFESVKKISLYRDYDAIVGDGFLSSIEDALESAGPASRILITSHIFTSLTITIRQPDISISCLPGVNITGRGLSDSLFLLDAERITFNDCRLGIESPSSENYIFNLSDRAKSALISNTRIFNFASQPFFKSTSNNLFQSGTVIER